MCCSVQSSMTVMEIEKDAFSVLGILSKVSDAPGMPPCRFLRVTNFHVSTREPVARPFLTCWGTSEKADRLVLQLPALFAASKCLQRLHPVVQGFSGGSCDWICPCHCPSVNIGVCDVGSWKVSILPEAPTASAKPSIDPLSSYCSWCPVCLTRFRPSGFYVPFSNASYNLKLPSIERKLRRHPYLLECLLLG
jgi:hypothetical protein